MWSRMLTKPLVKMLLTLLIIAMGGGSVGTLRAAEPSSWFVGIGGGYDLTKSSLLYSDSAKSGGLGVTWIDWRNRFDAHHMSWGAIAEGLIGYKHFLNDYIGLRYYANVNVQFFSNPIFTSNQIKVGVIDYKLNADLLLNLYTNPRLSVGIFGGFGVGGAHFDSPALDKWERDYGAAKDSTVMTEPIFAGVGDVSRNHFSTSLSVGARINFFQQLRGVGQVVCKPGGDGRRTCHQPTMSLEHSLEFNASFSMLPYKLTADAQVVGRFCIDPNHREILGGYYCSDTMHSYEISTPYKFTLRYILAF